MKNRVLKMGLCFSLALALLSGCAGKTEPARDGREDQDEEEREVLDREEERARGKAEEKSPGVVTGETPEEIIEIFMDAFEEQDAEAMLSCCYLDELVERYSFPDYVGRIKGFFPYNSMGPVNSPFYRDLALSQRKGQIAGKINLFTWSLLLAEDEEWRGDSGGVDFTSVKSAVDEDWAEEFEDKVDPDRIHRIKILSIDENNPQTQRREANQKSVSAWCGICGVDDMCERAVLFECDGKLFCKGFTLVQYDGQWQIAELGAAIMGDSPMGTATPLDSEDEYWDMIE